MNELENTIAKVADLLNQANRVLFITGAGLSADSELPTYRGVGGLYDGHDTTEGITIEEALSGPMFAQNPALTWKYLWQIGSLCIGAVPNVAHKIIAEIETEKKDVWVMTQNVDGLHRAAGNQNLVEVHGHMFDLTCTKCGHDFTASDLLSDFRDSPKLPPQCPNCDGIIRPKVVLFDESLPDSVTQSLDHLLAKEFDLFFVIGTSALFFYIQQPLHLALLKNKPVVEINPVQTAVSSGCQYRIPLGAAEAMQLIGDCLN